MSYSPYIVKFPLFYKIHFIHSTKAPLKHVLKRTTQSHLIVYQKLNTNMEPLLKFVFHL